MKIKRLFAVILAACMAFSTGLIGSSAEDAAPTISIKGNFSVLYVGQYVEFTFGNLTSDMELGILPDNDGNPGKWGVKNYRTGKTGTYRETFKMTDAGTYHVAVWTTGWNFQTSKKITVEPTPVISGNKRVGVGMNATFNISGIKSSLEFGIFPGNDDGSIKSYSVSNYAAVNGDTSRTVSISEPGNYVAAVWASGWSFVAQFPFRVSDSDKTASLDKASYSEGDTITVTTDKWQENDFFAIYSGSVTDITADTEAVYSGKNDPGKSSYTVSTAGWQPGEYRFVAFDSGDYSADHIADTKFTIKQDKRATMDKTTYTTEETITVTTKNWTYNEGYFIRIYKKPISSGYNSNFVADTYGAWAKETYKFYPYNWEPGEYQLIAFEYQGWVKVNEVNFTVTAPEKKAFEITDGILTANEEITLDLAEISPDSPDGKLFIGWKTANGENAESRVTLSAGDILTAQFIDFNNADSTDFKITDTAVRTEKSTGLRFTVQLSNRLCEALPSAAEYGTAVLPSDILNENSWSELELDKAYPYGDGSFTAAKVPAERLFDSENGSKSYTACITDITDEKLTRQYTVRGYIKYTDINGIARVLYTDYASANMYSQARAELEGGELSVSARSVLTGITETVKGIQTGKYAGADKITVTGNANNPNYYIYKLGENGISVRDVVIDLGLDNQLEIVQLSDMHFNYLNATDYKVKNPTVLSTNDVRTFGKNASSVVKARKALDFARTADAVVLTGDTIDYLSYGGIELLYKEIWDVIPDAMVTMGNHEYLQRMQGVMPESLSAERRWEILRSVWKHDIDYTSKVVGGKVMLIQLNNGEGKFYASQKAMLEADIALARANGYAVLAFMHEPISTGNASDTNITAIRKDDGSASGNYYSGQVGGPNADAATKAICDIIAANGDIIKGVFNGHQHADYYSEILAKTASGADTIIPQYTLSGCIYGNGNALKITVK